MAISCGDLRDNDNAVRQIMDAVGLLVEDFALRNNIGTKMKKLVGVDEVNRMVNCFK